MILIISNHTLKQDSRRATKNDRDTMRQNKEMTELRKKKYKIKEFSNK
jgi:hypothetical protein